MGSERNIPTLMFSFTFTSMHLATRPTTSGWERRRETGDRRRLPLPWCLDLNTHNHRLRSWSRGGVQDDDVKNMFAEMNDVTCRRYRSTKEMPKNHHRTYDHVNFSCNQCGIVLQPLTAIDVELKVQRHGCCNFTESLRKHSTRSHN